ncbi:T9SS type A sorting domain-containing protein [Hymenobacter monticola]|uniref:T9SS type A sorting domain-containing protein n=1 Tax=Hymenobacter monticola TaxID=1705399 RepID=A0ABY4B3T9_9BACT|nr:T9SS type A sorting domain-containing protein [Hymenobacter monticola]UOE33815.1 T9SS type A sorting domain-containing protein [Hymenobacter monticola]
MTGLLALFFLVFRLPTAAQTPTWQSAQAVAVATRAGSSVTAITVDAVGNVYLAGVFATTVTLGTTTLTSFGSEDIFVAKFNPTSNQFVWAQSAGGMALDQPNDIVVSGNSVYVAGIFYSTTARFGAVTLPLTGTSGGFIAKLTDAGNTSSFTWVQQTSASFTSLVVALAVSGSSVYATGSSGGVSASFGAITLTSAGGSDLFVAKLTDAGSTGSFVWVQQAGGAGSLNLDQGNALAVSGSNVYVSGSFSGASASFGPITLASAGQYDAFVAKLTDAGSAGSFVWAQRAGGAGLDEAKALAVSGSNVYVSGTLASATATFGAITLNNAGSNDVFVAKLTDAGSAGNFVWAQQAGGTGDDYTQSLAISGSSLYLAGYCASPTISFGPTTLTNRGSSGTSDVFVAKLTDTGSTGDFVWAQQAGGAGSEGASAVALSGATVYITGSFGSATASFGPLTLTNPIPNIQVGFLASLSDASITATAAGQASALSVLYPNPAHQTATLHLPAGSKPTSLTLFDAQGRSMRRYPAPAAEASLDLRGLPAGLYLLRGSGLLQRLLVE